MEDLAPQDDGLVREPLPGAPQTHPTLRLAYRLPWRLVLSLVVGVLVVAAIFAATGDSRSAPNLLTQFVAQDAAYTGAAPLRVGAGPWERITLPALTGQSIDELVAAPQDPDTLFACLGPHF